jgi:hypothetical protein
MITFGITKRNHILYISISGQEDWDPVRYTHAKRSSSVDTDLHFVVGGNRHDGDGLFGYDERDAIVDSDISICTRRQSAGRKPSSE